MYVLLQLYPPEAAGDGDETPLDVIAVDASEAALQRYLAAYKYRYRIACADFEDWDDHTKDWGPEHDHMHNVLKHNYQVHGSLIEGTTFKIVECLSAGRPSRDAKPKPEPTVPPAAHG
jgi:hypothetical protein